MIERALELFLLAGNTEFVERALEFALEILLPMAVALIIFKYTPSTANLKGPLQKFTLDFQGAFAAYFGLVLLIFSFHGKLFPPPPPPVCETWKVDGKVAYEDGDAAKLAGQTKISIDPPIGNVAPDGTFHAEFVNAKGNEDGMYGRTLHFDLDDQRHEPVPVYLDGIKRAYEKEQYEILMDDKSGRIQVTKPIILKVKHPNAGPAYNAGKAEQPQ